MVLRVVIQSVVTMAVMALLLFALAGTTQWLGGTVFIAAMGGGGLMIGLSLARSDPVLLKDRMSSLGQKKPLSERILLPLLHVLFSIWVGFMALDVRWFGAAQLPAWVNLAGGAAILLCFLATLRVFRENTFATAIVKLQEERGHKVIDTGPYAVVRHPLYLAAILAYFAIPFALGSWIGLLGWPLLVLLVIVRILMEEHFLRRELAGYSDYMKKVRYRLVPHVW
jgi:protein-S-isoprenylcysteine O-methyltransferase Ste14